MGVFLPDDGSRLVTVAPGEITLPPPPPAEGGVWSYIAYGSNGLCDKDIGIPEVLDGATTGPVIIPGIICGGTTAGEYTVWGGVRVPRPIIVVILSSEVLGC